MPRDATFYVRLGTGRKERMLGSGHAGLGINLGDGGRQFYITWLPTAHGLGSYARATHNVGLPVRMDVSKRLGFSQIANPMALRIGRQVLNPTMPNPSALDVWNEDDGDENDEPYRASTDPCLRPELGTTLRLIDIPVREPLACTPEDNLWGLDVDAVWLWWKAILDLPPNHPRRTFKLTALRTDTAHNCAGTVGDALVAGGLGDYRKPPTNIFFQGCNTLMSWITESVREIDRLNRQFQFLMGSSEMVSAIADNTSGFPEDLGGSPELPSLERWKQMSFVAGGLQHGLARRKEQVAEIDRLLPLYHAARAEDRASPSAPAPPPPGPASTPAQPTWVKHLVAIQEQCFAHLVEKRGSDRRGAMVTMARNVIDAIGGNTRYKSSLASADEPLDTAPFSHMPLDDA